MSRALAVPERRYCYLRGREKNPREKERGRKKRAKKTQREEKQRRGLDQLCPGLHCSAGPGMGPSPCHWPQGLEWGMFALYKTVEGVCFQSRINEASQHPFCVPELKPNGVLVCRCVSPRPSSVPCVLLSNSCSSFSQM